MHLGMIGQDRDDFIRNGRSGNVRPHGSDRQLHAHRFDRAPVVLRPEYRTA